MEGYIIDGTSARIINFPTVEKTLEVVEKPEKEGNYKKNYKVGEKQEVYPFRTQEDLELMYNHFVEKKQYRNALMFVIGINVGLRASDLLELKWNQNARTALKQVKDKKYVSSILNYTGDILLVGINYDKQTREHQCVIEEFQK